MSDERGRPFWAALPVGGAIGAYGLWLLVRNHPSTHPFYTFALTLGGNIAHDAVLAPVACVLGFLVHRYAPRPVRTPLTWALFATAVVGLIGYAPLRGFGRLPDNPSLLPLDYGTAIATVVAVVWAIAVLLIGVNVVRLRRRKANPTNVE